jgi:hypothetical protein
MQSASFLLFVDCLALPFFSTLSHKAKDFQKKVTEHKVCAFTFSTNFVWNIPHSKNAARYYHKCPQVSFWSTRYSYQILLNLESFQQIFKKFSNLKFLSSGYRVVPYGRTNGRTDRQTDLTKLIVAFRNFANSTKKTLRASMCCQRGTYSTKKIRYF